MFYTQDQGYQIVDQRTTYPAVAYKSPAVEMHLGNYIDETQLPSSVPNTRMETPDQRNLKQSPNVGWSLPNLALGVFIFFTVFAWIIKSYYQQMSEFATINEMITLNTKILNVTLSYIWTTVASLTIAVGLALYFGIPLSCGANPKPLILPPERCAGIWLTTIISIAAGLIFAAVTLAGMYLEVLRGFTDGILDYSDGNAVDVLTTYSFKAASLAFAGDACLWLASALYFFNRKNEVGIVPVRNIWIGVALTVSVILNFVNSVILGLTELDLSNPVEAFNLMMQVGTIPCLSSLTIIPLVLAVGAFCFM